MELPQLQKDELSLLEMLDQVDNVEFYAPTNSTTQNVPAHTVSLGEQNTNLNSVWLSAPENQDDVFFSDTESITSCGSAVASPAVYDSTVDQRFKYQYPVEDELLKEISVKELNLKLKGQPKDVVKMIKKRRRTLKNRGYAHSCRIKRIQEKSNLQQSKEQLELTIAELREQVEAMKSERDLYKHRFETLKNYVLGHVVYVKESV